MQAISCAVNFRRFLFDCFICLTPFLASFYSVNMIFNSIISTSNFPHRGEAQPLLNKGSHVYKLFRTSLTADDIFLASFASHDLACKLARLLQLEDREKTPRPNVTYYVRVPTMAEQLGRCTNSAFGIKQRRPSGDAFYPVKWESDFFTGEWFSQSNQKEYKKMNLRKNNENRATIAPAIVTEGIVTRVAPRTFGIQDVSDCGNVNDVLTQLEVGSYSQRNIADVCAGYSVISDDLGNPLSIVSDTYDLLQPVEAFGFFDALQGELGFDYTQAGFIDEGRKMFIGGNIGEIEVPSKQNRKVGDILQKRITAWTSFDGSRATSIRIELLRLWCANGCASWQSEGAIAKVKHTASQRPRLTQAIEQATGIRQVFTNLEADITELSTREVTTEQMEAIAKRVFPNDTKQSETARESVVSQFSNDRLGAFGENAWDAMNAFTAHLNHNRNSRQTENTTREENDFMAVSDSGGFVRKARQAIDAVLLAS